MSGVAQRLQLAIPPELSGERLDKAITTLEPALSRSAVQRLIRQGLVERAAGGAVASGSAKVRPGEVLLVTIPPPQPLETVAEAIPLTMVYEDEQLAVIDKPAGMAVHPGAGVERGTLVNALLHHCHNLSGIGGVIRPGIVHRLDKDTSGLLVIAKNDAAHQSLSAQFKARTTGRLYLAVVKGAPRPASGTVDAPIGRHPVHRQRMAVVPGGRRAVTHYELRERLPPFALIGCRLETGRTHQIRVHMAHLRHPLLGDPVYSRPFPPPADWPEAVREVVRGFQRQALHAATLAFDHPLSGERLSFDSPLPADMTALLAALRTLAE